jgi:UDP-N-acetylmuramoylalanine--D-glutamate ligase
MEMTMREYLTSLKNKKVAVLGIGVSNTPLIKTLLRNGIDVTACDKNDRAFFDGLAEELESLGAKLQLGEGYLDGLNHHVIFRTPGMRPDLPELQQAAAHGSVITSEMEAFFEVCPCEIIGVTGSDGKTTTTTIIAELLRAAGYNVYLGGNIGRPLFTDASVMVPGRLRCN